MGKNMQTNLEERKQEIRNKIKRFLEKEGIRYKETERRIEIKGEIYSADILTYPEISIRVNEREFLTVTDREDKVIISVFKAYPKTYSNEIELEKNDLIYIMPAIYFLENHLVFLF